MVLVVVGEGEERREREREKKESEIKESLPRGREWVGYELHRREERFNIANLERIKLNMVMSMHTL